MPAHSVELDSSLKRRDFLKWWAATAASLGLMPNPFLEEDVLADLPSNQARSPGPDFWEAVRKRCFELSPRYVYLNNSTMGPTLKSVRIRASEVQRVFSDGCTVDRWLNQILPPLGPIRDMLVSIVNGWDLPAESPRHGTGYYAGVVDSVTEGMSLVANGLTFSPADTILITDHEHTGGETMWELQRDRYGVNLVEVPLLGPEDEGPGGWNAGILERFVQAFRSHSVKVLSFPYVTTSTGHILPAQQLCALARDYGAISVVDAAQAFAILPINVQELDCDFLVVNGHKYLCGPIGSGFIVVNPRILDTVESFWPTVIDEIYYHPTPHPYLPHLPHRKGGLAAITSIIPLMEALAHYTGIGAGSVYERLLLLGQKLRNFFASYPDLFELITPLDDASSCVMTCFRPAARTGLTSAMIYARLKDEYGIHAKHATEGGADAVRLSPHYYAREQEIYRLFQALAKMAAGPFTTWSIESP